MRETENVCATYDVNEINLNLKIRILICCIPSLFIWCRNLDLQRTVRAVEGEEYSGLGTRENFSTSSNDDSQSPKRYMKKNDINITLRDATLVSIIVVRFKLMENN